MNCEDLKRQIANRVEEIINCIAQSEYDKLASITKIESSWCDENKSQESGIKAFEEWITEQLALWSEDEGKEFVVDKFDENCLDLDIEEVKNERIFVTYSPTSYGEELDFWFEIKMYLDEENTLISEFNVNI